MSGCQNSIHLEASWKKRLKNEFEKSYMVELKEFLLKEKGLKKIIYPAGNMIFNALNTTSFEMIKVVIIGQDPYHGPNQAHGLCFSVLDNVPFPPSLKNIFKELKSDLDLDIPRTGNLTSWAKEGVLLINSVLTVEKGKAASHQKKGWEIFTDKIIQLINDELSNVVFILWGNYAIRKGELIDLSKHHVIKSTHPSPLSAHRGFLGSRPFSRANEYLEKHSIKPVNWLLN